MKLTPTIVVQIGALVCTAGTVLLAELQLSPHEMAFLRALVAVILGLFFIQIGYAQSLKQKQIGDVEKRPPPSDHSE